MLCRQFGRRSCIQLHRPCGGVSGGGGSLVLVRIGSRALKDKSESHQSEVIPVNGIGRWT